MKKLMLRSITLSAMTSGLLLLFAQPAHAMMREMDADNNPGVFFSSYQNVLGSLPTSGSVPYTLYSDTYWPSYSGGAAWRWQQGEVAPNRDPHVYGLLTAEQLSALTDSQLALLSPAEKYDIAIGRFDWPTARHEMQRTSPDDVHWHGLCHAVAAVTARYYEPQNTTITVSLPDGQQHQLLFYSSDTKALLALAADQVVTKVALGLGKNCGAPNTTAEACWDTNPGAFYIALTNMVGTMRKPLLMDVDPGVEVWNAVIKSYSAQITEKDGINPRAAPGTVREVRVDMTLQHTLGAKPARGPVGASFKTETYAFTLELNQYDQIIGGEWISANRPDSLWKPADNMQLDPHFSFLKYLAVPL